jgi:MEDS: MEthanogen/methylotroph, DcmR Sensory domain
MARERQVIPLGWGDTEVPLHSYVAFYHTSGEAVLRSLAFLRAGLDEPGTFCMFLAEEARIDEFLCQLQAGYGGDVREHVDRGKLVAAAWQPDFEGLADTLMGRIDRALKEGYVRVRAMGLVAWAAVGWGDAAWLKRCESRINLATSMYPMVILCTYSLPDLPGLIATEHDDPEQPQIIVNDTMGVVPASMARAAMSVQRRFKRRPRADASA